MLGPTLDFYNSIFVYACSLRKLMVSHDLLRSTVTSQITFDQRDSNARWTVLPGAGFQMETLDTITFTLPSIPETFLHVTLKRQAEISADIFTRLLRYFFLSCRNLIIICSY